MRKPAPATAALGNHYGAHWWLVPENRKNNLPEDAFAAAGSRGQLIIIVPSRELVIVRTALDHGGYVFDPWTLLHNVLKAFP